MQTTSDSIQNLVTEYQPTIISQALELVRIPSVHNIDSFSSIINKIASFAEFYELPYRIIQADNENDLSIYIGEDEYYSDISSTLLHTSFATVDLGALEHSDVNPFLPKIHKNIITGSGILKNKTNIAIILFLIFATKKIRPQLHLKALFSSNTKASYDGVVNALTKGLRAKSVLYLGPMNKIDNKVLFYTGCRSLLTYKIKVIGEQVHSGSIEWMNNKKGVNAIEGLFEVWKATQDILPKTHEDGYPDGPTHSQTLLSVHGGGENSVVPDYATGIVEVRTGHTFHHSEYFALLDQRIAQIHNHSKYRVSYEILEDIDTADYENNAFVERYSEYLASQVSKESLFIKDNYLDAAAIFLKNNIPEFGYIPMVEGDHQNSIEEYADITDLDQHISGLLSSLCEED